MSEPIVTLMVLFALMLGLSLHAHLQHKAHRRRFAATLRYFGFWCREFFITAFANLVGSVLEMRDRYHSRKAAGMQLPTGPLTLAEYLELLKQYPLLAAPTGYRIAQAIADGGIDWRQTLRLRLRHRSRSVVAWKVFSDLAGLDPFALDELRLRFRSPSERAIVLNGPPGSGKTFLLQRLRTLIEEQPLPVVADLPMNFDPLRLLCSASNGKAMLAELSADLPPGWIEPQALTAYEKELVRTRGLKRLDQVKVVFKRMGETWCSVPPVQPMNFDKSRLFGDLDLSKLGQPPIEAERFNGALHQSNRGVFVADEGLASGSEFVREIVCASLGFSQSPNGYKVAHKGLVVVTTRDQELQQSRMDRRYEALLDTAQIVDICSVLDESSSLEFVLSELDRLKSVTGDGREQSSHLAGYIARFFFKSSSSLSKRHLQRVIAKTVVQGTAPATAEAFRENLLEMVEAGWYPADHRQCIISAIDDADLWLSLPHPLLALKDMIQEARKEYRDSVS